MIFDEYFMDLWDDPTIRSWESDFEKNNDLFVNLKKIIFQILPRSTRTKSLGVIMEHLQKLAKKKSGSGARFFLDFPGAGPSQTALKQLQKTLKTPEKSFRTSPNTSKHLKTTLKHP
jgi:hypothetical protein